MDLLYFIAKIKSKLFHKHQPMIDYYRYKGIKIGNNCLICSNIVTMEPFLINIGDNTTIASDVKMVTHDWSAHLVIPDTNNLYGRISIGSNCFIGRSAIVMYGVTIPDNTIVAAGSVVTKSVLEQYQIIAGNPARVIGTWDKFREKYESKATPKTSKMSYHDVYQSLRESDRYLVKK